MRRIATAKELAREWDGLEPKTQRAWLRRLIRRIDLESESLGITINQDRLAEYLAASDADPHDVLSPSSKHGPDRPDDHRPVTLKVAVKLKRAGMETRLLIQGDEPNARAAPDRSLHRLLGKAEHYRTLMMEKGDKLFGELAAEVGVCSSHFSRVLRLSFLAPDIIQAVLQDRHPVELNAERLAKRIADLPLDWDEQRKLFGP
jgi:hypothetical protein